MNTYKRDEKISNDTIFTQKNQLFYYVHIYTKSGGFIRRISTKESISATKHIYKITKFWHLSTLPSLKHCLSQTKSSKPKETKDDNQRITNQQVFKTENKCMVQTKTYTANTNLPLYYNNNI